MVGVQYIQVEHVVSEKRLRINIPSADLTKEIFEVSPAISFCYFGWQTTFCLHFDPALLIRFTHACTNMMSYTYQPSWTRLHRWIWIISMVQHRNPYFSMIFRCFCTFGWKFGLASSIEDSKRNRHRWQTYKYDVIHISTMRMMNPALVLVYLKHFE